MLLHKKELRKKEAIKLNKELDDLRSQIQKIQPVKLDKPIFDGYIKSLTLIPEAEKRKDYQKIKECLDFIGQHTVYCKNKTFLTKNKNKLKPGLKTIPDPRFQSYLSDKYQFEQTEKIKSFYKYLQYIPDIYRCNCHDLGQTYKYKFTPHFEFDYTHLLQETITEKYFTHYYPVDSVIESRIKHIYNKFDRNNYWSLLYNNKTNKDYNPYSYQDLKAEHYNDHKLYFTKH